MADDRAIFQDEAGRGWLVEVEYGRPVPGERGIRAVRFTCPEAPEEPVRVGYAMVWEIESADETALREALGESEPAREIG